jgi:hypothetical protein
MSLTIRAATEDDQPTIRRLIKEVHLPRMNLQWANFVVAEGLLPKAAWEAQKERPAA